MASKKPEVSFIVVNFQSRAFLARCLSSIQKISETAVEIIVVNNDSVPLEPILSKNFPIQIIQAPKNLGFGSGANLGAHSASGEYLFFLNPDAEIMSDYIQNVINQFRQNSDLAILGGKIIDEQGKNQNWIAGKTITPWKIIKNNLGLNENDKINRQRAASTVDWVSGGAMMTRKNIFDKLNGFDEKFFMYYEDIDLCRRAQDLGFQILYFPSLLIRHLGGKSFSDKKIQKNYYYQSQEYYFQKHFGRFSALMVKWLRIIFLGILSSRAK